MKNLFKLLTLLFFTSTVLVSCNQDDPEPEQLEPKVSYIVNYGSYSGDKSTITSFDKETGSVANNVFESINGVDVISNIQHATSFNNRIYFMGNSSDQVFWVDGETFTQTENAVTSGIVKPRYGVGRGNYLYVSCWGGDIWADETTSYIAKINITNRRIEKKIALPGGPEGMALLNNKLYAALNYKDSVAVVNLGNDEVSYIKTPAVTSYFVQDPHNNLYVSFLSTYSDPSDASGIGYINTTKDQLIHTYDLEGVSTSYVNILAPNDDFSKLYVMTSAYDASWNLSGAVSVFNVATKSFEETNIVEGISGLNGIAYYNNKLFTFVSETVTGNGTAVLYDEDGTKAQQFETGIAPFMLLTVEK